MGVWTSGSEGGGQRTWTPGEGWDLDLPREEGWSRIFGLWEDVWGFGPLGVWEEGWIWIPWSEVGGSRVRGRRSMDPPRSEGGGPWTPLWRRWVEPQVRSEGGGLGTQIAVLPFRRGSGGPSPRRHRRGSVPVLRGYRAADRRRPSAVVSLPPGGPAPALLTPPAPGQWR
jgi:hypothetical protein